MDNQDLHNIAMELQVLYKTTMDLYQEYFNTLEVAIKNTPLEEEEKIRELNDLIDEAQEALNADLVTFAKVVSQDLRNLEEFQDKLQIEDIYKKLNN